MRLQIEFVFCLGGMELPSWIGDAEPEDYTIHEAVFCPAGDISSIWTRKFRAIIKRAINLPPIMIREIEETDIPGFRACLDAVAKERRFLAFLEAPPLEKTAEYIHASMEKGDVRVVAVDGSQLVGWCDIRLHGLEGLDHVGELGMGVLKEYRGRGLGLSLLQEALRTAQERGVEKVELDVFASNNPAINLYEKVGFEVEGRKRRARKLDGAYDDIIVMGLFLKPSSHDETHRDSSR